MDKTPDEFAGKTPEEITDILMARTKKARPAKKAANGAGAATEAPEPPRPLMRELPPADPFPIDALGDVLAPAARAIQDRVQAPLAICGQSVLASATLAVQAYADVVLPIGGERTKPLSSYFVTIAETGDRKTECDFHAGWAIKKHEKNLREKSDVERLSYENDKLAYDKAREAAVKKAKGERTATKAALDKLGPPPPPPLMAMITSTEPTFEGLAKQFGSHPPSLGIFSSEGGQFVGGHGMNEENKLKTASGLSSLWDGEPVRRVRAGEGCSIYAGRRLAVHLMIQPNVGAILFQDELLLAQGLLSRVLLSAPESTAGTRLQKREKPETDATIKGFGARLLAILETPLPLAFGKSNELAPPALHMSKVAEDRWLKYVQHIECNLGRGGELEPIKGLANKLPEHAARVAGVLTLVKDIKAIEIAADDMDRGIALADHYAAEALRIFEAGKVGVDLMLAQRLLNWLHGSWTEDAVSCRDMYQKGPRAIREKATAARMVAILADHGWLIPIPGGAEIAGQRNREAWRVIKRATATTAPATMAAAATAVTTYCKFHDRQPGQGSTVATVATVAGGTGQNSTLSTQHDTAKASRPPQNGRGTLATMATVATVQKPTKTPKQNSENGRDSRKPAPGNDTDSGQHCCEHCGRSGAERWPWRGGFVWLHDGCQHPWADAQAPKAKAAAKHQNGSRKSPSTDKQHDRLRRENDRLREEFDRMLGDFE